MENNKILNITSIADLQSYAGGSVIELPPFAQGQPFVARLRRPSLLMLMKNGKIPNTLLAKATQLFDGNTEEIFENDNSMSEVFDVMEILCEASFVEPTYKEIKDAGVELTDDQLMFVFNYSQQGINAITPFH